MKTAVLIKSVMFASVLFSTVCLAGPQIGSSQKGRHYLVSSDSLHGWSLGAYLAESRRDVELHGFDSQMKLKSAGAFIGYDIMRWASVFGIAGSSDTSFGGAGSHLSTSSSESEFGVALQVNLLDHELMDPTVIENRLRLNAQASYMRHKADHAWGSLAWNDLSAGLMLSIINDTPSFKIFWVENVAIYGGPVYSRIFSSDRISEKSNFGYAAGVEIGFSEKISLLVGVKNIDTASATGSITVRF